LFTTGIQYSVPIFTGGALNQQVKIDQLSKNMSQSRAKLSREELIYNIRSLYISGLTLQELISYIPKTPNEENPLLKPYKYLSAFVKPPQHEVSS
jgi:hypothetical protein